MNIIYRVLFYPLVYLTDTPDRLLNWWRIRILRREQKWTQTGEFRPSEKISLFAVFPGTSTLESVKRAANILRDEGYLVVFLINANQYSDFWALELQKEGFLTIQRENIGADFGAYKLGVLLLQKIGFYDGLKDLLLINDSIYVTPLSTRAVKEIAIGHQGFNCLFLHRQSVPHAGSMLIRFNKEVLQNSDFLNFWNKYYSYSNKKKVIRRGEHKLSEIIGVDYFSPYADVNNHSLLSNKGLLAPDVLQVLTWSRRSASVAATYIEEALNFKQHSRVIEYVLFNLQVSNSLGLFFAREIHCPLKMDLVSSALINLSDFTELLKSSKCSSEEIIEVEKLLKKRGSYFSAGFLDRIERS